ncbi:MAG: class I SAM-dependent methyltransferase [Azoarcus sp.]|nr:class I SAM-dependent methyltransferase [Azoarcus sp.]
MPSPALLLNLALDLCSRQRQPRVPEPALLMADAASAASFMQAGREDGILAHTYLYHAIQASAVIPAGAQVVDLGCGPANQLALIARLNPDCRFVGIDAADSMLVLAGETLARQQLHNVELRHDDMSALGTVETASADVVISTMSLHHLADVAALERTLMEAKRILKPGGGVYLVDFGRLKREATQHFFATERRATQPEPFTEDYYNSLRAAFSLGEIRHAAAPFGNGVQIKRTFLVPLLIAIRSARSHEPRAVTRAAARASYAALSPRQQYDFRDLARFFRHGGFGLAFKP